MSNIAFVDLDRPPDLYTPEAEAAADRAVDEWLQEHPGCIATVYVSRNGEARIRFVRDTFLPWRSHVRGVTLYADLPRGFFGPGRNSEIITREIRDALDAMAARLEAVEVGRFVECPVCFDKQSAECDRCDDIGGVDPRDEAIESQAVEA